ncbi:MAG: hypothetical protein ACLFP1_02905, partial [Candidatus Goldiibacteriota bacterium]
TETITETATETVTETITETATATVTETITETATETITETATETVTETITETATETITETVTETATETITETVTETVTETITETATETVTETITATATESVTETVTETITETATETITETATETATETVTETITYTITPTATDTLTPTVTETDTPTITETVTETATETATPSVTETMTETATETVTETTTETITPTDTPTTEFSPTVTETATDTVTRTSTPTLTLTATASATPTNTQTYTSTYTETITPSMTMTLTATPSITYTSTETATPTISETETITPTSTITGTPSETATQTMTPTITMTETVTPEPNYEVNVKVYNTAGEIVYEWPDRGIWNFIKDFEVENPVFSPDDGGKAVFNIDGAVYEWDGKNTQGGDAENGKYYIHAEVKDKYGFVHSVIKEVMLLTNNVSTTVNIYNSAGELVKTIPVDTIGATGSDDMEIIPSAPDAFSPGEGDRQYAEIHYMGEVVTWDGTNNSGMIVSNGVYMIELVNIDENGVKTVKTGDITVLHNGYEIFGNVRVLPNPVDLKQSRDVVFRFNAMENTEIYVKIYNMAGELITNIEALNGENEIRWRVLSDERKIASGLYIAVMFGVTDTGMQKREIIKFTIMR